MKLPMFGSSPLGRNGYRECVSVFVEPSYRKNSVNQYDLRIRMQWDKPKFGEANIYLTKIQALFLMHEMVNDLADIYPMEHVKAALSQVSRQQGALEMSFKPELFKKASE